MQSLIQRFNWVEKFDFSSVLQLLAVSTNSVIRVRIVLEFLRLETEADDGPALKRAILI